MRLAQPKDLPGVLVEPPWVRYLINVRTNHRTLT